MKQSVFTRGFEPGHVSPSLVGTYPSFALMSSPLSSVVYFFHKGQIVSYSKIFNFQAITVALI